MRRENLCPDGQYALGDAGAIRDWLVSPAWRAECGADLASLLDRTRPSRSHQDHN
jgi:hypothetical protein